MDALQLLSLVENECPVELLQGFDKLLPFELLFLREESLNWRI